MPRTPAKRRYFIDLESDFFGTVWMQNAGADPKPLGEVKLQPNANPNPAAVVDGLSAIARGHALAEDD